MSDFIPSLSARVLKFLSAPGYQPLKHHELAHALGLSGDLRPRLRQTLRQLEREGQITCLRKNRWALPQPTRLLNGTLSVHPQGFGFVLPAPPAGGSDVFIPSKYMGSALHGDGVQVELSGRSSASEAGRREGRVVRVVSRSLTRLVGLLQRTAYYWYVMPDNARISQHVKVRAFRPEREPRQGRKVLVELDPPESGQRMLTGVVTEDLGDADAAGVDMISLLRDRGLEQEFRDRVLEEATSASRVVQESDVAGRRDCRGDLVVTIDPEDAKDFDDAVSLRRRPEGGWELDVHIADVAHYVTPGSEVDREARRRGNSVYMVDRFIPMLPKYLTSEVCSLRPHTDRLAHSGRLGLDAHARVVHTETFHAVIHSRARLNYDQVQALIQGREGHAIPDEVQPTLREMARLADLLRRQRMERGAIDLSMPEVKCELDEEGRPVRLYRRGAPEAYHLIEEFMLLANVAVAELFSRKRSPALYRIHEPPSDEQWAGMADDLAALGLSDQPATREDLNEILHRVLGTPLEYTANLAILRNFKRALYSSRLVEHFGLAFDKYTHFTSPIRRYPDLVVHRLLSAHEQHRPPPYSHDEIAQLALHCSATERNADEAEEESLAIKRIQFYQRLLENGEIGPYPALVVGVLNRGLLVEIIETLQRGLVPFTAMGDDFYEADPARGRAVGRRRRRVVSIGQVVAVELLRVDRNRRQVDFRLAREARTEREKPRTHRPSTAGKRKGRKRK